jgi:4-diphosphocytidyl-2-C-methyl-D-erythritol kinase
MREIKAHAKVNIFLKITGYREGYHTLISRFMRVENLYDTIRFVPAECERFTIEGTPEVPRESNTLYKAWIALNEATGDPDLLDFFYHHKVVVEKRIPSRAGLGGGSSDAGAFLRLANEACNLKIGTEELARIGARVGADVPFFVHDIPSANVSGFGEVVEPFDETPLDLELFTPPLACDTASVYRIFRERFLPGIAPENFRGWAVRPSRELLSGIGDPQRLNDLYPAALLHCPDLKRYAKEGWYFSGSGSSFFRPKR